MSDFGKSMHNDFVKNNLYKNEIKYFSTLLPLSNN